MNDQTLTPVEIIPLEAEANPAIYSKRVIYVFSVLLSAIFGGVLLMINLRAIGEKKIANFVLLGSIAYTVLVIIIANTLNTKSSSLGILSGIVGGYVLSEIVFKKYIPDADSYAKKPIWIPSIIGLVILSLFILAIFYGGPDKQ